MSVHLGFPQKSLKLSISDVPLGKIGGNPLWLSSSHQVKCCSIDSFFLCQILAPGDSDDSYYRYLYVFQCPNCKLPQVIRSQLPRANPLIRDPEEPAPLENDWNADPSSEDLLKLLSDQARADSYPDTQIEIFEEDAKVTEVSNALFSLNLKNEEEIAMLYELMEGGVESAGEEKINNSEEDEDDDAEDLGNEAISNRDVSFEIFRWFSNYSIKNPVIRYCKDGKMLWYSDKDRPEIVAENCRCGRKRVFECQVLPQIISYLHEPQVEFGNIYIFTCPVSCGGDDVYEQGFYHPSL